MASLIEVCYLFHNSSWGCTDLKVSVATVSLGLYFTLPERRDEAQQALAEGEGGVRINGQGRGGGRQSEPQVWGLNGTGFQAPGVLLSVGYFSTRLLKWQGLSENRGWENLRHC